MSLVPTDQEKIGAYESILQANTVEITMLRTQLAEKEKEIEKYKQDTEEYWDGICKDYDREIAELQEENEKYRLGMQENCDLRKEIAELRERLERLLEIIKSSSKCSMGGIDTHYSLKIRVSLIEEIEQAIEKAVKA